MTFEDWTLYGGSIFSFWRTDLVLVERIKYHDMIDSSEIYQLNSQAEKNYVHRFLNGKQLRVASLEVSRSMLSFY